MSAGKLIYLVTEDHYFYSHRLPMARAAQRAGFDVAVIANVDAHRELIEKENIRVIPLPLDRRSLNPLRAIKTILALRAIYRREKPAILHHIAMKPVLYGTLAATGMNDAVIVNAFAGLGYLFTDQSAKARLLRLALFPAFRLVLRRPSARLLLQNRDDLTVLSALRMTPRDNNHIAIVPGSGVDTDRFAPQPLPPGPEVICAFAGRFIAIKGLATLFDAFDFLAREAPRIKLWLCGAPDNANPGSWTEAAIAERVRQNPNIALKGKCADMAAIWAQAHMAVQPSWGGEGVPKSLLEAASCARAIVASDVAGCRDAVEEGRNGFLVPPRDARALADAIKKLATNLAMGEQSRLIVNEKGFSAEAVTARMEELYRSYNIGPMA
jgi:glycosyltransferase involved in cell wall biosynthesis